MKPPPFKYYDPTTQDEALALLGRLGNAKLLAGGQSLLPMLNMRLVLPDHVIDLNRIAALDFIRRDGDVVRIGAMTRQRSIEFSPEIAAEAPLLAEAIAYVGHRQTRNRGTIGGSLAHLDPAAELVTAAATLDAAVTVAGPAGERSLTMSEFQLGYMTPALGPDELLVSVAIAKRAPRTGWGFVEFARRHGDFAIASAAAVLETDGDGKIVKAAITLGGVAATPCRMPALEGSLVGARPSEELFAARCGVCAEVEAMSDALVTAQYRRRLAPVMARRALIRAMTRLNGMAET